MSTPLAYEEFVLVRICLGSAGSLILFPKLFRSDRGGFLIPSPEYENHLQVRLEDNMTIVPSLNRHKIHKGFYDRSSSRQYVAYIA